MANPELKTIYHCNSFLQPPKSIVNIRINFRPLSYRNRTNSTSIDRLKTSVLLTSFFLFFLTNIPDSYATEEMLCNCVAFRLDDIQDYFLNNVQIEIIKQFGENNATLTVGIIGNYFSEDRKIVSFLNERLNQSDGSYATLKIANHGWNHEDFTVLEKREQSDLIAKANQNIFEVLGVRPSVFIAPFNRINDGTIEALLENEIYYVSANITSYPLSLSGDNNEVDLEDGNGSRVYHFPSTVITGDLNSDDTEWYGIPHMKTIDDIDESVGKYGYAIVTLHPQEYSLRNGLNFQNLVDEEQMRELEMLLKAVNERGLRIVSIEEISNYSVVPEFEHLILYVALMIPLAAVIFYSKRFGNELGRNGLS